MKTLSASLLALVLVACPSTPTPPPVSPEGGVIVTTTDSGSGAFALCGHLAAIGCPQPANCAAVVKTVEDLGLVDLKEKRLFAATSREEAIAVGTVVCADL